MDALKELVAPMLKEDKPNFNIGDVIRIGVKIREGEKKEFRLLKVPLSPKTIAALPRPLPFAA